MLLTLLLIMLAAAPLGLLAGRAPRPLVGWALAVVPLGVFGAICWQIPAVLAGARPGEALPWVPAMGVELRLGLDGLGLLFALLVTGIGTLVVVYTGAYMAGDPSVGRFYVALFIFMGSMLGLVLSDNILTLFLFWELTSVSSYLLVGHKHSDLAARRGAQMGLLITVGGGLALLVGLVLLGAVAGTYTLSAIVAAGDALRASPLYAPALALVLLGCFTKSAQFPFHFWLPNAMAAPTPASAFLHSATMVKAGVFLLARLHPALGGTPLWAATLTTVGAATMLVGAAVALRRDDIKSLLAYSTVSALGTMVLLLGIGGPEAPGALMTLILAHGLYKGALFMLAGAVDHGAGTRKLSELGGLRTAMPATFVITAAAALSMAGVPPLFGFVAKEELLYAVAASALPAWLGATVTVTVLAAAILGVAYAWRLVGGIFLGARGPGVRPDVREAAVGELLGPVALTLLSVALPLGLLPAVEALLQPAAAAAAGPGVAPEVGLYLIPQSLGLPAALSALVIIAGAALARFAGRLAAARSPLPGWLSGDALYDAALDGLLRGATAVTGVLQSGRLRSYMRWSLLTLVAAVLPPLALHTLGGVAPPDLSDIAPYELIAALLIPVGVLATIGARSRLGAIVAVGIVGAMVAFLFVIYSAPDLAMTQLLVEVIATVFFMLVFAVLPPAFERLSSRGGRVRDAVVAGALGLTVAGVTYGAATGRLFPSVAEAFKANSLSEGKGANVVNVILVDFRGLDTLAEITVLFAALLGVYAMLRLRHTAPARRSEEARVEPPLRAAPPEEVVA